MSFPFWVYKTPYSISEKEITTSSKPKNKLCKKCKYSKKCGFMPRKKDKNFNCEYFLDKTP